MKNVAFLLTAVSALVLSTSAFAFDCRAIFDPGYSKEAQALIGTKFRLVDEAKLSNPEIIPFRILVKENIDANPETLTLKLVLRGKTIIEEAYASGGFNENVVRAKKFLEDLPACEDAYQPIP